MEVPFFWATTRIQVDLVVRVVITARAIRIVTHTVFAPLFAQRTRIALLHTRTVLTFPVETMALLTKEMAIEYGLPVLFLYIGFCVYGV